MLFNSFEFLIFFPIVALLFFAIKHEYRWFWLLAASCFFYMFFKPIYILILFFTIVIDYFAGIAIENQKDVKKRRRYLIISIIANVLVLAIFKYFNFLNLNFSYFLNVFNAKNPIPFLEILLPIGLSFHTFQAMSYTIEVYRGSQKAERHFGYYSLYVMFFPQLVAGPIERPQNILHQFHEKKFFIYDNAVIGLRLMLLGFFKKVVIADNLSVVVNTVYSDLPHQNSITLWIAAIFFSIQIYCDFSGYSNIAIGTAKFMGYDLMQNFNQPYFSTTIKEFWSKWHISLSTWFRDYLYIPLGGSKKGIWRKYFNTLLVFMVSGLWHGANFTFIVWGFIHGVLVSISNVLSDSNLFIVSKQNKFVRFISLLFLFVFVTLAWIYFRANTITEANYFVKEMIVGLPSVIRLFGSGMPIFNPLHLESKLAFIELFSFVGVIFILDYLMSNKHVVNFFLNKRWVRLTAYGIGFIAILFLGYTENASFIYFQF
jgi:alginate O-acetyltransferase complex protein AlgI